MTEKVYRPVEAARLLGISKDDLLGYEREGRIPPCERDENGNRAYTPEDVDKIREILGLRPRVGKSPIVIAVFNMKGGVGKSTLSSNVAWKIAERGYRTLAVDADPQGHMTTALGQEPSKFDGTLQHLLIPDLQKRTTPISRIRTRIAPNLHLAPSNLSMCSLNLLLFQQPEREYRLRRAINEIKQSKSYDLIVVDSPPAYDLTSLNILLACDLLLAPVKLDGNSFYGLEYLLDAIRDLKVTYRYQIPRIVIVANHYNHSYSVSRQILEGLKENYGPFLAGTVVRQDVNFDKANALREPIFVTAPSSKGSRDLEDLTAEVVQLINSATTSSEQSD
ncbi:AAA family ATPase [Thermodesulfobacteriota bacterium]